MAENIDWAKIKAEYVTSKISLNKLAEKYEINKSTIAKKSMSEKWVEERKKRSKKKADKVAEKLSEKDIKQTVKDIDRCCKAAGKLIDKINKAINEVDKAEYIYKKDTKTVMSVSKKDDNGSGVEETQMEEKRTSNIKKKRYTTLINTKKINELSKSLMNIKEVLSGFEDDSNESVTGIIEIPAMAQLIPPDAVADDGDEDE